MPCTLAFREQTENDLQAHRGQADQVPQQLQEKLIQSEKKLATVSLERAWVADTFAPPKPKKEEEDKKRRDEDKSAAVISTQPIHLQPDTLKPCAKKDTKKKQRITMLLFAPPKTNNEEEDKKGRDEGNSAVVMATHAMHLQPGTLKSCAKKDTEKKQEEDKAAANATRQPARNGSSSGAVRLLLLLLVAMGAAFYFVDLGAASAPYLCSYITDTSLILS